MSYILNLSLPLWWMFLPLIIAFVPTAKWSKWKAKYYAAQYKAENNALQLIRDFERHKTESEKYRAEIAQLKLAIRQADDNLSDVRLTWAGKSEKDAEIIRNLNAQAAEREALIVQLRKDLTTENEILSERLADKNMTIDLLKKEVAGLKDDNSFKDSTIQLDEAICKDLRWEIEQLKSKLELSELAHGEINHDYQTLRGRVSVLTLINEDLKSDLVAAIAIMNRTIRGRKQWGKYEAKRAFENYKPKVTYSEKVAKEYNLPYPQPEIMQDSIKFEPQQFEEVMYKGKKCYVNGSFKDSYSLYSVESKGLLAIAPISLIEPIENYTYSNGFELKTEQTEVVHDILGVARVFQADQSESVNNRHIKDLGGEVVRGIAEQKKAIEKELASVVDMSQLEVGDKVVFRHGDVEVVREILKDGDDEQPYLVSTRNSVWYYTVSGKWQIVEDCDLDIVQIIKPAKCYKSNKPCQFNCDGLCKNS